MRLNPGFIAVSIALGCLVAMASRVDAGLIASETFDYAPGELNGQAGGLGWSTTPWAAKTAISHVVQPATPLVFAPKSGGWISGGNGAVELSGNDNAVILRSLAEPQSGRDLYLSFLLRWEKGYDTIDFLAIYLNDNNGPNVGLKLEGGFFVRVFGAQTPVATGGAVDGKTYFLAARLEKANESTTYNRMTLWVDPEPNAPGDGVITPIYNSGLASFTNIGMRSVCWESDDRVLVDRIMLGSTWDSVVQVVPEPSSLMLGGIAGLGLLGFGSRRRKSRSVNLALCRHFPPCP